MRNTSVMKKAKRELLPTGLARFQARLEREDCAQHVQDVAAGNSDDAQGKEEGAVYGKPAEAGFRQSRIRALAKREEAFCHYCTQSWPRFATALA